MEGFWLLCCAQELSGSSLGYESYLLNYFAFGDLVGHEGSWG